MLTEQMIERVERALLAEISARGYMVGLFPHTEQFITEHMGMTFYTWCLCFPASAMWEPTPGVVMYNLSIPENAILADDLAAYRGMICIACCHSFPALYRQNWLNGQPIQMCGPLVEALPER